MENELRDLLEALVKTLDGYNQPDMLGGYLDPVGEEFNERLEALGLPTVSIVAPGYRDEED